VKPLIYGYMRVDGDEPDEDVRRTERGLRILVEVEGYCYAGIFYEYNASRSAFATMIEELERAEAHHAVVPSLRRFADNHLLRNTMLTKLGLQANALVLELSSRRSTTSTTRFRIGLPRVTS
jgi:DNA invertase Pin-like site-specific DNA recombinase